MIIPTILKSKYHKRFHADQRQVKKVEERVEPSMESKTDYEEWLKAGNNKAEEILNQLDTDTK